MSETIEPLPDGLASALGAPAAYPLDPTASDGVATIQTHISHVFLTPTRVYKLRKAVDPGFLDFGTRAARNADCLREVALNRRFAPDVYLGVAPAQMRPDGPRVGPTMASIDDPALEHCVVMRRLPDGRDALSLLDRGVFGASHIDRVAGAVSRGHRAHRLGGPAPWSPEAWRRAVSGPVEDNFEILERTLGRARPGQLADAARRYLGTHGDRFERRRRDGRAVDGHGDLHLAHVWFEDDDGAPLFVDCIEFSEGLRRIDAASDLAFLAMDLAYRGQPALADRLLRRYAVESGDYHLYAVVDYFMSYRAAVRAKVAAMAAAEPELPDGQRAAARASADRHLDLATQALQTRGPGAVVILTGIVGTGKSTAADAVAETIGGAVVIASDRLRKALAGFAADEHRPAAADRGIYDEAHTERVYAELLDCAEPVVASGRVAVLDATYSSARRRHDAVAFARRRGLPALLVETRCAAGAATARLAARQRDGRDPSDAGPDFHAHSVARFDPVEPLAGAEHIAVETDLPDWPTVLAERVRVWRPAS